MKWILNTIFQAGLLFFLATFIFDICHYLFHRLVKSKYSLLRTIGHWHLIHHRFYTPSLQIDSTLTQQNIRYHVLVEYAVQLIALLSLAVFFTPSAVLCAASLQVIIFICVLYQRGQDPHHRPYQLLPPDRSVVFVSASYHALHHVHPQRYFSSYVKLFDWLFGFSQQLKGKRISMTGANGALGRAMKSLLEKEGAHIHTFKYGTDYHYDDYSALKEVLVKTDILFLCHGSKQVETQAANCHSFVAMIELFKSVRAPSLLPLEVWAVGSEIEFHPCFGIKKLYNYANSKRDYARHARQYYHDANIQYRHLVHSAFTSSMGPGLMSAGFAAWMSLFFIKRGFKYIPVSYMGFAYFNYFRYAFNI